ncbi:hypothetical protein [Flavobacterium praedii]|uniref:hypothetical protein n=1 Tax=Flavobacterium praedii TaxID=3002900 RepID=UPI002481F097|nr:hypothetical protein [Flavobacterium praedii]
MKTKKLKKRLNKLEASLNSLMYYLKEKPLDTEAQKATIMDQDKEYILFNLSTLIPESMFLNEWIDFRLLKHYFEGYSSQKLKEGLKEYCQQKDHTLQFSKKLVKIESSGHSVALTHFIIVT